MGKGFREMLAERQKKVNSLVCVGLDPLPEKLPQSIRQYKGDKEEDVIRRWFIDLIDATAPYACMFKPQRAHYEAFKKDRKILINIVEYIHEVYPDIPVFLDCKRGDIGRTQERYGKAHFAIDGVDGINFSPYMGKDCMEFLVDKSAPGRAIVGLCFTSNPSARETQDIQLADRGRVYWEFMAETILRWAEELGVVEDAGLVMAAAYEYPKGSGQINSYHLSRVREIVGNKLWFLIPGIGTQGGFVEETIKASFTGAGSIAINSSSEITFASSGPDFAEAAAKKAKELRDKIRAAGGNCG
jgi:orotidine-5'-phosphate decarboxylase